MGHIKLTLNDSRLWKRRTTLRFSVGDISFVVKKPKHVTMQILDFFVDAEGRTFGGKVGVFSRPEVPVIPIPPEDVEL